MDHTEVTVAAYSACVRASACTPAWITAVWANIGDGRYQPRALCNVDRADRANHPQNCVDHIQATAYCQWSNARLPTEEEWERAARGDNARVYPWGDAPPTTQLCWSALGNGVGIGKRLGTCNVDAHAAGATREGIVGLAGNVWEWTSSKHSNDYASPRDDSAYVTRGGGWGTSDAADVRGSYRKWLPRSYRNYYLGFRCVAEPTL